MGRNELTEWQEKYLQQARALVPGEPPEPWGNNQAISAAGIFAGGWTMAENFVLLSSDGYSVFDPRVGKLILFELDPYTMYANLDQHTREFLIPFTNERVSLFGLMSGDGIHVVDGWTIDTIYPWWPNTTVMLQKATASDLEESFAIDTGTCDPGNWIKCGFAPSGNIIVIVGHGGAEFYSRAS